MGDPPAMTAVTTDGAPAGRPGRADGPHGAGKACPPVGDVGSGHCRQSRISHNAVPGIGYDWGYSDCDAVGRPTGMGLYTTRP